MPFNSTNLVERRQHSTAEVIDKARVLVFLEGILRHEPFFARIKSVEQLRNIKRFYIASRILISPVCSPYMQTHYIFPSMSSVGTLPVPPGRLTNLRHKRVSSACHSPVALEATSSWEQYTPFRLVLQIHFYEFMRNFLFC